MFHDVFAGKRCLVTGHNGFKGSWLSLWLMELGAEVYGYSLAPPGGPTLHETVPHEDFAVQTTADIRDYETLRDALRRARPDVVFHLAAQPIVRLSYADPLATLTTNVTGTAHLLEAIRSLGHACTTVIVTSDKCYENREWEFAYRENDPMGGHDPYSMSKGAAELVVQSWNRSFFLPDPKLGPLATARAGNVIGGGDYAPHRIVPDCVRALAAGEPIRVRNPAAIRPWQHVLECLSGYLTLASRLVLDGKGSERATSFNFGPGPAAATPVRDVVEEFLDVWPGEWFDESDGGPHEAKLLNLATDKAANLLSWRPAWTLREGVRATAEWYRSRHVDGLDNAAMADLSRRQIRDYTESADELGIPWARRSGKAVRAMNHAPLAAPPSR